MNGLTSVTDLTIVYLWFVLGTSLALVAFMLLQPEMRSNFREIFVGLYYLATQPNDHFYSAEEGLYLLLRKGLHGATLELRSRKSGCTLRFEKYIRSPGAYGIKLVFPIPAGAEAWIGELREFCSAHDLSSRLIRSHDGKTIGVLHIGLEKDTKVAKALARKIWTDFFELPEQEPYQKEYSKIASWDDLIDRRGQRPKAFSEYWEGLYGADGPTPSGCVLETLLKFFGIFLHFALLISLLAGWDGNPDWKVDFGIFTMAGTTTSLVFFSLYIGRLIARRYLNDLERFFARKNQGQKRFRHHILIKLWRRTVRVTLPLSALIIWTGA